MSHIFRTCAGKKTLPFNLSILVLIIGMYALSGTAHAVTAQLAWTASTSTGVSGYKIYYGCSSGSYDKVVDAGAKTTVDVAGLEKGTLYCFAVKAYDTNGNASDYSQELVYTTPAASIDTDSDGISDQDEAAGYGTDPTKADSDGDGIPDGQELTYWGGNWSADSDGDGVINLLDPDSDNDGATDGDEINRGSSPTDPNSGGDAPSYTVIPQANFSIAAVDSEELTGENGAAQNAIDGKTSTIWHTEWSRSDPSYPHHVVIQLNGSYLVNGIRYLPRQDGNPNGTVAKYNVYVSDDVSNWGEPVASGTFPGGVGEQQVLFTGKAGSYVKLEGLSEINGNPWMCAAELNILGTAMDTELAVIPHSQLTIESVDSEELIGENGAAQNAIDGNSGTKWHTEWYSSDPTFPHEIVIKLNGWYQVNGFRYLPRQDGQLNGTAANFSFYVSPDGLNWGNPVVSGTFTGSSNSKQVLFTGKEGYYVKLVGLSEINDKPWMSAAEISILGTPASVGSLPYLSVISVDSEELTAENGTATNAIDGDPKTFWHTEWSATNTPYPHEIVLSLGGCFNVTGFRYLPRQDGCSNGALASYSFYVSEDGVTWGNPAASGSFAEDANQKEVLFSAQNGCYVKLKGLSEVNGKPWMNAAEIGVLCNQAQ